jgi:polyketide synthase 5
MADGGIETLPLVRYGLGSTTLALRQFATAQHVGKVVVSSGLAEKMAQASTTLYLHTHQAGSEAALHMHTVSTKMQGHQGTWTITGGLGALGLLAASWLIRQGCRHVMLLGRSGR